MAGHSKRHNIKHRKAAQDAKKSKVYAKVAKVIQMAAKQWDDLSLNPTLETALVKARQEWLPKDVIQKAIDKGAGNDTDEQLVEIFYEWYGPGWIALYIKCVTSNTNRSWWNVRAILTKYWWSLGSPWSVAWQFQEKWEIYVSWKIEFDTQRWKQVEELLPLDEELFELAIMETPAENYEFDDGIARIVTSKEHLITTVKQLESNDRKIESSEISFLADNEIVLDERWEEKLERLIEMLEEDDDVDTVWHNAG